MIDPINTGPVPLVNSSETKLTRVQSAQSIALRIIEINSDYEVLLSNKLPPSPAVHTNTPIMPAFVL